MPDYSPALNAALLRLREPLSTPPSVAREGEVLRVEFAKQEIDMVNETVRYFGGVRASFGVTVILCDELLLDRKNKTGVATGRVRIVDPDGEAEADNVKFGYGDENRTGEASNVRLRVERMRIQAQRMTIEGDKWTLENMRATPSLTRVPEFELTARRVEMRPGRGGVARHLGLDVFGKTIGSIPYITFSLDNRVTGFRLPSIAFQRGQGVGVSFGSTFLLNDQTSITGKIISLPKQFPSAVLEVAGSAVAPESMIGRLTTRTDLMERLTDHYGESVIVPDGNREVRSLRGLRDTWSIGSYWNQASRGRLKDSEEISKSIDLAYERSGPLGPKAGYLAQFRAQTIRESTDDSFIGRFVFQGIAHTGWYELNETVDAAVRMDIDSYGYYTNVRTQAMLRAAVHPQLDLAIGSAYTLTEGSSRLDFEEPFSKRASFLRADLRLGSITASALGRYDWDRRDWVSAEYTISLVAGAFEPFVAYRQYPRVLQFGARLRVQEFFSRLASREIRRKTDPEPDK